MIITIPATFFVFGWKDIELNCQRSAVSALPTCTISESFAMRLFIAIFTDPVGESATFGIAIGVPATKMLIGFFGLSFLVAGILTFIKKGQIG